MNSCRHGNGHRNGHRNGIYYYRCTDADVRNERTDTQTHKHTDTRNGQDRNLTYPWGRSHPPPPRQGGEHVLGQGVSSGPRRSQAPTGQCIILGSEIMTFVINASAVFFEPADRLCQTQVISLINARAVFLFCLTKVARPGSYSRWRSRRAPNRNYTKSPNLLRP